ncbi:MAG TPA: hypothetical protein DEB24_03375 [Coriobacteriia bacterium]|nr:hypothetical protein [Coriobacteriia bacterium]
MGIWRCANFEFDLSRPLIMGIVNVTPDSFSDGGDFFSADIAYAHARELIEQGADLIDVGGESTRPGSDEVSCEEESARVLPVVSRLAQEGVAVSIDTRHASVARACVEAGAVVINDVSGFRDAAMVEVAAGTDAGLIVMHMAGRPKDMQSDPFYENVVEEVGQYLLGQARVLEAAGVLSERIAIDPGPGFGKNFEHNRALLKATDHLSALGYPLVAAWSRKSFVGQLTGTQEPKQRIAASVATAVYGATCGARILRVHDVAATKEALAVFEATDMFDRSAIIGLGANMGDAEATLKAAMARIAALDEVTVERESGIYVSEPAYREEQQRFHNAVMRVKTTLEPLALLGVLRQIEDEFGRVRDEVNGPRVLDLDIIDYEGVKSDDPALLLPHPLASERDFVVTPLLEIAPGYVLADGTPVDRANVTVGRVVIGDGDVSAERPDSRHAHTGKLSICATPIGNLGDITKRVIEALKNADRILAEDTRVTRRLLSHLNIRADKLERCDENRIRQLTPAILEAMQCGERVALVSDAGMPGIADPGSFLIDAAIKAGCMVEVLPGASAVLTAVVASGLFASESSSTPAFYFGGFLPRKKSQIAATLEQLAGLNALLVFFESPHRVLATLEIIAEALPGREVALTRELTKLHEEILRDKAEILVRELEQRAESNRPIKGEIVLVIASPTPEVAKRIHCDKYAQRAGKAHRQA